MDEKGIMRMRPQEFVDIAPGQSLSFEPGGHHLMLIGVESLQEGDEFQISMNFESQLSLNAIVNVGHFDRQ